ncbi:MAG: hypothetical protein OXG03_03340 [Gammaproteobacteria bacterium]|nr:hypothetical protein [Gammaproteobacteria bacterium]
MTMTWATTTAMVCPMEWNTGTLPLPLGEPADHGKMRKAPEDPTRKH